MSCSRRARSRWCSTARPTGDRSVAGSWFNCKRTRSQSMTPESSSSASAMTRPKSSRRFPTGRRSPSRCFRTPRARRSTPTASATMPRKAKRWACLSRVRSSWIKRESFERSSSSKDFATVIRPKNSSRLRRPLTDAAGAAVATGAIRSFNEHGTRCTPCPCISPERRGDLRCGTSPSRLRPVGS